MHEIRDYKDDPFLSLLRPLVEAYLAFYRVGNRHIQSMGLTPGQFDVIAELEGTEGLTCAQLSEKTLTTKGTLTGVLDRLEARGFIQRGNLGTDRRAILVSLTAKGLNTFENVFPAHAEFMRPYFSRALNISEVRVAKQLLCRVRDSFENGTPFSEGLVPHQQERKESGCPLKTRKKETKKKVGKSSRSSKKG